MLAFSALLDRIGDFRSRKVADPGFRRWAGRFFLTRPIARRQAKNLFDLTAGFVYSQVLLACVRVDLFQLLAKAPLTTEEIASSIGLPHEATERLLKAAAALKLVEGRSGGRHALGALGAALVDNPGVTAMILHNDLLYGDLRDPLALLTGQAKGELSQYWAYDRDAPADPSLAQHARYTALMAASQPMITAEILDAYRFEKHSSLLDIGGGDATFLLAVARIAPHLKLVLFDLPPVAALAEKRISAAGLAARVKAYGGSFLEDDLPVGADLVTLNRVLHDHDDDVVLSILKAVRLAIAPHGTVLIAEPMAGTAGAEASGDAYFGLYLFAMGRGRPRTVEEYKSLLFRAGFERPRLITTHTPLIARILTARPQHPSKDRGR